MGNASGRSSTIKHGHMRSNKHKGHHHSHNKYNMRSNRHRHTHRHGKNRTHRRRRYGGGLSPKVKSKLSKVFTAPANLLEETTTDDTPYMEPNVNKEVFKIPSPTEKFKSANKGKNKNRFVVKHVNAALRTYGEVQEARERAHASKSPSKGKRNSKDDAGPMIAYKQWQDSNKKKEAERLLREEAKRKENAAAKKANEESFTPHQQRFGRAALKPYIPEEEEEVKPSAVKPLTPAQRKKMNAAVKKSIAQLDALTEEDEEA